MRRQTPEGIRLMKQRVIDAAEEAFHTIGVKDVTMDSIARKLKMSKRTIYELFSSKEALLLECIHVAFERESEAFEKLKQESSNSLEFLLRAIEYRLEEFRRCDNKAFRDLDAYPSIYAFFQEQHERRKERAVETFYKGVQEGYFRTGINYEIVYFMSHRLLKEALRASELEDISVEELFRNTILLYFSGCVTAKGVPFLEKLFQTK